MVRLHEIIGLVDDELLKARLLKENLGQLVMERQTILNISHMKLIWDAIPAHNIVANVDYVVINRTQAPRLFTEGPLGQPDNRSTKKTIFFESALWKAAMTSQKTECIELRTHIARNIMPVQSVLTYPIQTTSPFINLITI